MRLLDRLLTGKSRRIAAGQVIDRLVRDVPGRVAFVTRGNVPVSGNLRIVLDAVADLGQHEIGLFKDGPIATDTADALRAKGVRVFEGFSLAALWFLHTSPTIVLTHSARDAYLSRRKPGRRVVNLWHGVALKRIEALMPVHRMRGAIAERMDLIRRNGTLYDAVLASSAVDRLVNSAAFMVPFDAVHPIGLPRFDYLRPAWPLPPDLRRQEDALRTMLAGRRLVLYAPTFRDDTAAAEYAEFTSAQLDRMRAWCAHHRVVLGVRSHPYQRDALQHLCDGTHIVSLNDNAYPEPALLLRQAAALVVDYSSIWVDFLITGRPIVGYAPDYQNYMHQDRGFVYDHPAVFPGPIFEHWGAVQAELDRLLDQGLDDAGRRRLDATRAWLMRADVLERAVTPDCIQVIFPRDAARQVPEPQDTTR